MNWLKQIIFIMLRKNHNYDNSRDTILFSFIIYWSWDNKIHEDRTLYKSCLLISILKKNAWQNKIKVSSNFTEKCR